MPPKHTFLNIAIMITLQQKYISHWKSEMSFDLWNMTGNNRNGKYRELPEMSEKQHIELAKIKKNG